MTQDYLEVNWNLPLSISLKEKGTVVDPGLIKSFSSALIKVIYILSLISVSDEDSFLLAVINDINSSTIHFKLSPAYVFYLVGRFFTSHKPVQSEQKVCMIFDKIVHLIQGVIQVD